MTQFYVGTAGWSYLHWDKEFYPGDTVQKEKLAYYASRFNAVELNNSFYHTPAPEQFTAWEKQVPAGFRFAVKASRYITHTKKLNDAAETLPPFLDAVKLQKKSGPLFFQLPPSFSFHPDRLTGFLKLLPAGRRYAMELRNPTWHNEAVYALLKQYKVAFCLFDTPEGVSPRTLTTDFAYVRLRGRSEKLKTFLREWKGWLSDHTGEAYVFFDNREEKRLAFGNALAFRGDGIMKIATYNVNGVNGRLPVLLRWLEQTQPDVACLQELKAPQEKFPEAAIRDAGYSAVWHGQKSWNGVAILARGIEPEETQRGLPGDPDDSHSRYIEAKVNGIIIGCLYLPNGNPAPGPKFDYKLKWFERLTRHAAGLLALDVPVILAGDYNVMPTELDVYKPERWLDDALFRPETRAAFQRLMKQGWTDALRHMHPGEKIYTFFDYFRNAYNRNAGLRIDHVLLSPHIAGRLAAAGVDRDVRGWEKTSDHAPTWVELADKTKPKPRLKKD